MLTPSDFIRLSYTPDLTEGGIAYAVRSLPYTYNRMGGSPYDRLRRIVGGVAVELAFRRHLSEQEVPFDVQGATPFTDPDRYDVSLGGHRCDVKSFLLTRREQISELRRNLKPLLQAPALVPSDQFAADGHSEHDLYLFAFLTALTAASHDDLRRAIHAGQSHYLIHALPNEWTRPQTWQPLGKLALKSEADQPVTIELGGQNETREFITETIELPPRTRLTAASDFYALSCIHLDSPTEARLGIHSPVRSETYLISPHDWGNIWVYGLEIILAGYLTREEFRRKASQIAPGSRVYQYSRTRTKNLGVPVADLRPLPPLLTRVKAWEKDRTKESP